ncbi:hypothetical protein CC1G_13870 [Coprinopsis cinerea okayama7|uniref:Glycoside hydrolase family 44 catalytic domain-containing protein n=1 Tax=Coprinopsis cinerea (strain Okayama-7 / 130 / ATCC MYA-4618 / FGSC 9003) TaxID=240176 RepID=D6RKF9_COPC7|nr:hypothetical protein CC1G_13870 [Coprinopsis cinerea okayama7\|eukprot:XP_002911834.1 hypothetical protein CC1G_13870 [Coprinopsis cinerea okayama7\
MVSLNRVFSSLLLLVGLVCALDDLTIYQNDGLTSGWENWSWNTETDFANSELYAGESGTSLAVKSSEWAALSLKGSATISDYAGLRFDIAGDQPGLQIYFTSTTDDTQSASIVLSDISDSITPTEFSTLLIDFKSLPGTGAPLGSGTWDRITFQALSSGASYHLDNVVLVGALVVEPKILSAEPIASNTVAVTTQGEVDAAAVRVFHNGRPVRVTSRTSYSPPDTPSKSITYLTLGSPLSQGNLAVVAGESSFNHTLPRAQSARLDLRRRREIDPHIYGVNWPKNANYIRTLGVTFSRWGGNAVTAYNPFEHFTNAGSDWFFENRGNEKSDDWIGWIHEAGSDAIMTVPALDWVAKDATSYSYPRSIYPEQERFNPYNPDSGNGRFPNGTNLSPPTDPNRAYTPWNTTQATTWLSQLKNKPKFATIDNEIEIAAHTHTDMHPEPMSYDEELDRVTRFALATKEALPDVKVLAPSPCSWWFYWTSAIGWSDTEAHNNTDFLPWFLQQMRDLEGQHGKRLLDYLDIHYYFQPDTSAEDAAAKALRLRMTRSLWDETYIDESWIGSDPQNHQPNPRVVSLIPRFKKMIQDIYPGTKLSVSEWSATNENDITGGLVAADALGIFGKYGLDAATYWATPNELGPTGLAYWLYRGYGTVFGSTSVEIEIPGFNPDILGVYAAIDDKRKFSVVIVNKNPSSAVSLSLAGLPPGRYFLRHFGGEAGIAKWQTTTTVSSTDYIVVPSYTAVFLLQR